MTTWQPFFESAEPARPLRGHRHAQSLGEKPVVHTRGQPGYVSEAAGNNSSHRRRQPLESPALVNTQELSGKDEPRPVRKYMMEEHAAERAHEERPAVLRGNLSARGLDQAPVFHTRGARSLTSAAVEAQVHVPNETFAERQSAALDLDHLINSSARRIHLDAELPVSRTSVQTKSAVGALGIEVPLGLLSRPVAARRAGSWLFPGCLHCPIEDCKT